MFSKLVALELAGDGAVAHHEETVGDAHQFFQLATGEQNGDP